MYHPPSKQRQIVLRVAVYSMMTLAVVGLVTVSLLYILGYRFDQTDRKVEQSGLVQYVSTPAGATVEVDGKALTNKTPAKSVTLPGQHEFVMWREGYETWRKTQDITAGTLMWFNYARLVPKDRPVEAVETLPTLAGTLASPNDKYIAALPDASIPTINVYNVTGDDVKQSNIILSADDYAESSTPGVSHSFGLKEWSKNGRYLLIEHVYAEKREWLVVDRQDTNLASNVTQVIGLDMTAVQFANTDNLLLYALVDESVRKINITNKTVSGPLVSDVSEYYLYDDNIIGYVGTPNRTTGHREVGVIKDGEAKTTVMHTSTSPSTVPLHVAVGRYFGKDYFVMSEGKKVTVWKGAFPANTNDRATLKKMTTFSSKNDVLSLQLSPEDRFIIAQHDDTFMSYDLELMEASPEVKLAGTTPAQTLSWIDNYTVWSDRSDMLIIQEFDGTNKHAINPVATGFDVSLSENGEYLYSVGKTEDGFQLQRVRMILN